MGWQRTRSELLQARFSPIYLDQSSGQVVVVAVIASLSLSAQGRSGTNLSFLQNFRHPGPNGAVNKRNLSTGENGEFGAEGVFSGQFTRLANASHIVLRRAAQTATRAKCLG